MTISAMFVAWSATRSRKREIRMRRIARGMVRGSSIMKRQELPEDLLPQRVHLRVLAADLARQRGVPAHEGVEALLDHPLGLLGHPRQVHVRLELGLAAELEGSLGDVHCLVADALDVRDDL